jgi:hypothetical protein
MRNRSGKLAFELRAISLFAVVVLCGVVAISTLGQTNGEDKVSQAINQQSSSGVMNAQRVLPPVFSTNNVTIKGVLWGDCITNQLTFFVSILVKNNGRSAVYVPEKCEDIFLRYQFKRLDELSSFGGYHTDDNNSRRTKYVRLGKNEVKEYTVSLSIDCDEADMVALMIVRTKHNLSAYDREKLNEAGYQCIQDIECELRDIKCVNNNKRSPEVNDVEK